MVSYKVTTINGGTDLAEADNKKPKKVKPVGAEGHRGRMFERFLCTDDKGITARDLIEILMFFSVKIHDTRDSAVRLMKKYKNDICALLNASQNELEAVEGVGASSAMLLRVAGSIVMRLHSRIDNITSAPDEFDIREVFPIPNSNVKFESTEIALFDGTMHHIRTETLTKGAPTCSREELYHIVNLAVKYRSHNVMIARMTGERASYPSTSDINASRYIEEVLRMMDITLVEYYVISDDECIPTKELYL